MSCCYIPTSCCVNEGSYGNISVCSFCEIYSQEKQIILSNNKYGPLPDLDWTFKENGYNVNAEKILSEYSKKNPHFVADIPRIPKTFKPTLLYHSYQSGKNEHSFQHVCLSNENDGSHLPENLQHQYSGVTDYHATKEHTVIQEFSQKMNQKSKHTMKHNGDNENKISNNLDHYSPNEFDQFTCHRKDTLISIKTKLIQNSDTDINKHLGSDCHRSAFSKPHRFGLNDSYSSNMMMQDEEARIDDVNIRCSCEKTGSDIDRNPCCELQSCIVCPQVLTKSDTYTEKNRNVESPSFSSSLKSELCLPKMSLLDWERYIYYSNLIETYPPPMFSQRVGNNFNSSTYGIDLTMFDCNSVDNNATNSNVIDPQQLCCQEYYPACLAAHRLQTHFRIPTALKPYTCECGRTFARNEELTRHKRIHSGHRPFQCSICEKTFGRKDHLNKHRTTHLHTSEKKVHVCNTKGCLQKYTRSDALARHQWATHGIRPRASKWRPQQ